jgi:putative aldouronate transport system permease protein
MSGNAVPVLARRSRWAKLRNNKTLIFMCLPAIVFFFVFSYIPMPGLIIAFQQFNYGKGIFGSKLVGFQNFKFLTMTGDLWRLTFNTVVYNLAFIITTNVFQIIIALMLNEVSSRRFQKVSQTLILLPYFISYVLVGLLAYNFLSFEYGILNGVLKAFGIAPVQTYSSPGAWPWILIGVNLWKSTGYGSIIYFAALTSIDQEVVEASVVDGANAWQRIRRIYLPHLRPTFVILLLFSLGGILRGNFGLFYNLVGSSNSALFKVTDIIETFVFRSLVNNFNFSLSSAVSLYQSLFGFLLIIFCNWLVRRIEPDYALF